jgi:hypothetical protein
MKNAWNVKKRVPTTWFPPWSPPLPHLTSQFVKSSWGLGVLLKVKKFDRWMFELFGSETDHEIDQAVS